MTRRALQQSEAARSQTQRTEPTTEMSTAALLKTLIETLSTKPPTSVVGESLGPREWKPPVWDGKVESFRDYLARIRSSYRVRAAMKPTLPDAYY